MDLCNLLETLNRRNLSEGFLGNYHLFKSRESFPFQDPLIDKTEHCNPELVDK